MKYIKRIAAPLLALALILFAVLPAQAVEISLVISGDGVEKETVFTYSELVGMTEHISQNVYSACNTWPTKKTFYTQGVSLMALLEKAGLKDSATTINIAAEPEGGGVGYNMTFLLDDLLAERYTFEGTKTEVPAIIALKLGEKDFNSMDEEDLRLIHGQLNAQEQTTVGFVQSVRIITVTCGSVHQLPQPEAFVEPLANGQYSVTLTSSNVNAKVYYTTDGTTPTVHSKMYNVSAAHWQPQLNVPFAISGNTPVKAIAVVSGYADSEVLAFTPSTLDGKSEAASGSVGMANFAKINSYKSGQFNDVDENQWYGFNQQKAIASAFDYGLMKGASNTAFNPAGNVTIAEAITVAARVHCIYTTGKEDFIQGNLWYQVYVDYAIANGLIKAADFSDYTRAATRAEMADIFSRSLPQSEFKGQNIVNSLPDVHSGTTYRDSIIMLYQAGILSGSDSEGTFYPNRNISRAEAAAIISRVILPTTRISERTF